MSRILNLLELLKDVQTGQCKGVPFLFLGRLLRCKSLFRLDLCVSR